MQVTELANDGLKRAYSVIVTAGDIATTRDKRLAEIAKTVSMPGFRPGKVPMSVVKQRYGAAVLGEVLEQQVTDASRQVVTDRGLKPALQPKIDIVNFAEGADLEFRMDLEVLPEVPMPEFAGIELERLKTEPTDEAIDKALASIAERNGTLEDAEPRAAGNGDILVCDFTGRLPENLLKNGVGLGARPGSPGEVPTDWSVDVSGGLAHEVAAIGSERGLPYFDAKVTRHRDRGRLHPHLRRPSERPRGQAGRRLHAVRAGACRRRRAAAGRHGAVRLQRALGRCLPALAPAPIAA